MAEMTPSCGECKHFLKARSPITGHVLPSKPGKCGYKVIWPTLPAAYYPSYWLGRDKILFPLPAAMYSDTRFPCEVFDVSSKKRKLQT